MEKLKNLISGRDTTDTDTNPEADTSSRSTGVAGQGSHFPRRDELSMAQQSGLHETTSTGYVPGTDIKQDSQPSQTSGISGPGTGTAAIGETSTYSSHRLPQGGASGSFGDPTSTDRTAFEKPEHTYSATRGVPEGGPMAAAAAAFHKNRGYSTSNIPGAFPKEPAYDSVTVGPSSSTSTANPADQSATYSQAEQTRIPDANAAAQSATSAASTSRAYDDFEEPRSGNTVGGILGGAGLGTAAAGAGIAASRAREDAAPPTASMPDQPTTTTGLDSYTAPTQSTAAQPSLQQPATGALHRRKESIPTTAYPAGINSPAAINAPIGGTTAGPEQEYRDHTGRNAGIAAAGAGAGAAAFGAHEYGKEHDPYDRQSGISDRPTASQPNYSTLPAGSGYGTSNLNQDYSQPSATSSSGYGTSNLNQDYSQPSATSSSGYGTSNLNQNYSQPSATSGSGYGTSNLNQNYSQPSATSGSGYGTSNLNQNYSQPSATSGSGYGTSNLNQDYSQPSATSGSGYGTSNLNQDYSQPSATSMSTDEPRREPHQYGTTAAAAGVGAGAAAFGTHEYGQDRALYDGQRGGSSGPTTTQYTSSAAPIGSYDDSSNLERNFNQAPTASAAEPRTDSHSYGRTAAATGLGAGAGVAGLGAYEYERDQGLRDSGRDISGGPSYTQTTSSTVPIRSGQDSSHLNQNTNQTPETMAMEPRTDSHSYGRTAAATGLGAGAGAAGLGAYEYERDQGQYGSGRDISGGPAYTQTTSSALPIRSGQDSSYLNQNTNQTPETTAMEPRTESHPYGRTAAAAGIGAGAGAVGAYALENRQPETGRSDWPLRDDSTTAPTASTAMPTSYQAGASQPRDTITQQREDAPYDTTSRNTGAVAAPYEDRQSRYEEPSQKHTARQEAALVGTTDTDSGAATSRYGADQTRADDDADRRRRHEKEAAAAGVAGAGAGAAGLHEHHQHEEDEARRQKELDQQEEARRKQYEADEKAAKKEARKEEKEEAKQQKAIAKEEKKQEKEEKKHEKELEKERTHDSKAAVGDYDERDRLGREDRERHERELAGAAAGAGAGTAAYEVHDRDRHFPPTTATDASGHNKLHKDPPDERKPGLLKRLFGRRKNKDTGEDEDYEIHEHDPEYDLEHHRQGIGAAGAGTGTGIGSDVHGTAGEVHHGAPGSYQDVSGGAVKPSYNPFTKDDPSTVSAAPGTTGNTTGYVASDWKRGV